ncbi:hypothetical protein BDN70DRAFT_940123 [Pholiota conissans]|uniref:Uncharacterized protein n=1 Tax=Pholiota conissans TaxID=109636 RepID=A0A9P5YIR8_9AGAR|nr:hypothetical protein BDN70DRAFT_940123 [Pholiota conissans]
MHTKSGKAISRHQAFTHPPIFVFLKPMFNVFANPMLILAEMIDTRSRFKYRVICTEWTKLALGTAFADSGLIFLHAI